LFFNINFFCHIWIFMIAHKTLFLWSSAWKEHSHAAETQETKLLKNGASYCPILGSDWLIYSIFYCQFTHNSIYHWLILQFYLLLYHCTVFEGLIKHVELHLYACTYNSRCLCAIIPLSDSFTSLTSSHVCIFSSVHLRYISPVVWGKELNSDWYW
jgi:hypothetical protein